ncbi:MULTISPECIES: DMT family transporter [unclassified Acinetobacter]|uniref:DMT family transporter n=1 Tax=unclassified Acinetobacter TaxID=196816 RepID=UPI00190BFA30|nr:MULTISPECIES: DMT family transporter [unclassified Acinetobacter]MBK0063308.1 DMT family transporter [Acinetobacter sp. S55]MBK0066780.1 DMT family transporter [Acinetobacter sp. S54]
MNPQILAWCSGLIGVIIFSGSLPATRIAVMDMSPWLLTGSRAVIGGMIALILLKLLKVKRPDAQDRVGLIYVALGVVIGFPLFTALALQYMTAAYSIVFVGLLPLSTAVFAVIRGGERPKPIFWIFALLGSALVLLYIFLERTPSATHMLGILYMLAAIIVCGLGYAEGGKLSRKIGGWQVICWALVISLPVMLMITILNYSTLTISHLSFSALLALLYVSLFSMLIGFFFWYHGLAQGGIATVGQLQLLQPLFGLALAALLLHESISWIMLLILLGIIICVAFAKKFA